MGLAASHAAMAAPMQGLTEISLGILLVIGLLTRPAAFVAFLFLGSLWISELGTRGSGNCWFRCSHRLGSRLEAPAENGALTHGWRNGGHLRPGGDRDEFHVRVSVVIPTHNEAQAIERVLADLPSDLTTEVIVVDSNSNDGTPEIAARMGARVVQEPRRGYGRACLTGLAAANSPDVVVFLDGDYSDRPSELPILLAPIIEGHADITLGSRLQGRRLPEHYLGIRYLVIVSPPD